MEVSFKICFRTSAASTPTAESAKNFEFTNKVYFNAASNQVRTGGTPAAKPGADAYDDIAAIYAVPPDPRPVSGQRESARDVGGLPDVVVAKSNRLKPARSFENPTFKRTASVEDVERDRDVPWLGDRHDPPECEIGDARVPSDLYMNYRFAADLADVHTNVNPSAEKREYINDQGRSCSEPPDDPGEDLSSGLNMYMYPDTPPPPDTRDPAIDEYQYDYVVSRR